MCISCNLYELEVLLHPANTSLTGRFLNWIDSDPTYSMRFHQSAGSVGECIADVAIRTFLMIGTMLCAAADLLTWAVLTATIVPAYKIGARNHLANLISSITSLVLSLAMPFGGMLRVDKDRLFCEATPIKLSIAEKAAQLHPLCQAAYEHDAKKVEDLIKNDKADPNSLHPETRATPLMHAIVANYGNRHGASQCVNVVKALLDNGAKPEIEIAGNITALMLAATQGSYQSLETTKLLLDQPTVDPNHMRHGYNALHLTLFGAHSQFQDKSDLQNKPKETVKWHWGSNFSSRGWGVPNPDLMSDFKAMAKLLIAKEAELLESDLDEVSALLNIHRQNQPEQVQRMIKLNKAKIRSNPFISLIGDAGTDARSLEQSMKNIEHILHDRAELKQAKKAVVDERAIWIEGALLGCGENGLPKELATIISEYCYS